MQNRHQSFQICKKMKKNIQNKTPDLSFRCDFIINSLSRWHYLSRIIKRNRTNGDTFCQKFTSFFSNITTAAVTMSPKCKLDYLISWTQSWSCSLTLSNFLFYDLIGRLIKNELRHFFIKKCQVCLFFNYWWSGLIFWTWRLYFMNIIDNWKHNNW